MKQKTLSESLAAFITGTSWTRLGAADISAAKAAMSDTLACMVAGSSTDTARIVRENAEQTSARGVSSVVGGTRPLSSQFAALCNGTAAHALDYDDILWSQIGHPSATVLSASLAVAETIGATGRDLVLAYAIGVEVIGKLGRVVNPQHYEHGWHATSSIGVIGSTAACARLLGLSNTQTAMALGIAASEASGVRRNFGTMTKPFHAGDAARGAVLAAELAQKGFTSSLVALEGLYGWAQTLNASSVPDAATIERTLGTPWELTEPGIALKRYAACGAVHCALDAIVQLRSEHKLAAEEIEAIDCDASPFAKKVLIYSNPQTGLEGKFSMEFSLAVAAIEGHPRLRHYENEWVRDPRVLRMLERTKFETRADLAPDMAIDAVPAEVRISARGTLFHKTVRIPIGDPRNPMTTAHRREKFLDCAARSLGQQQADELFDIWEDLEKAPSARKLTSLLHKPATQVDGIPQMAIED